MLTHPTSGRTFVGLRVKVRSTAGKRAPAGILPQAKAIRKGENARQATGHSVAVESPGRAVFRVRKARPSGNTVADTADFSACLRGRRGISAVSGAARGHGIAGRRGLRGGRSGWRFRGGRRRRRARGGGSRRLARGRGCGRFARRARRGRHRVLMMVIVRLRGFVMMACARLGRRFLVPVGGEPFLQIIAADKTGVSVDTDIPPVCAFIQHGHVAVALELVG
jgi:hypothetical protein